MLPGAWQGTVIGLHAGGGDDPDGSRTAAILAAYFDAEHARAFRRLLWRRLGAITLIAMVFEAATRVVSASMFAIICAVLCGPGIVAPVIERRAERKLMQLLRRHEPRGPQVVS